MPTSNKPAYHAVLSTALPVEYMSARAHLRNLKEVRHDSGTIYEVGEFTGRSGGWQVALLQTGQGNPRAALEVERAITFFEPSHVFFLGIAGGLKDVRLGDVVAVTKAYGYEYGKADEEFKPRAEFGESTYAMIQEATFVARREGWLSRVRLSDPSDMFGERPRAFVGPIVAGEKLIASTSSSAYRFFKEHFSDALAVEMESYGFFRAVHANHNVQALVVRGISDMIDRKAEADGAGSQERASAHAAAFMFEVLARAEGATRPQHTRPDEMKRAGQRTPDEPIPWRELEALAIKLYPHGPGQDEVWSRAGGDMSALALQPSGKGSWHAAVRTLRLGGGGAHINPSTLISTMLEDYHANDDLKRLAIHAGHEPTRTDEVLRADQAERQKVPADADLIKKKREEVEPVRSDRTKIFISYSHNDVADLQRLQVHLKPLEREGLVERWDDTRIRTGQRWKDEIEKALASAKVAVLLVSADFLASDFINEVELPSLLTAAQEEGLVIMPVILSPCRFKQSSLSQFQAVNPTDKPLNSLSRSEQEALWVRLTEDIESVLRPY